MKTLKLNLTLVGVLVIMLFASSAFASATRMDDIPGSIPKIEEAQGFNYNIYAFKNALKFKLAFEGAHDEDVRVRIFDKSGNLVHKETLRNHSNINRNYDMTRVGAGIYKVEIEMGDLKAEHKVALGVSDNTDKTFQAYMSSTIKDGAIRVFYKNGKDVNITMRDTEGEVIYTETTNDTNMHAKKYNISALRKGTYVLTLTSGDRTIEKIYAVK